MAEPSLVLTERSQTQTPILNDSTHVKGPAKAQLHREEADWWLPRVGQWGGLIAQGYRFASGVMEMF